ncbi:restriction endonuclease-like protein [Bacillus phage DZ1]|uniref:Restriction endonuclease-like protein n=1 Tax=Bacillus phage DZ1 TaxID=3075862 RepID=A0AA96ERR4_9CAUD|nr:restriction endonuclease-like protein [Bacillus phage DZ1]
MSKFNAKKIVVDGIKFDSEVESRYYAHLMRLKAMGEIKEFTMQPAFVLQEAFTKHGKDYPAIKYKADFQVWYIDGTTKVIDIKGMKTPEFKLKEKLYAKQFDVQLICICESKIDGGWIEFEALQKARAARKKEKEKLEKAILKDFNSIVLTRNVSTKDTIGHLATKYSVTVNRVKKLVEKGNK